MRNLVGKDMYQWNWKCEGPVNRKRIEDPLMHYYASLPLVQPMPVDGDFQGRRALNGQNPATWGIFPSREGMDTMHC
jgi:hypothetical protein